MYCRYSKTSIWDHKQCPLNGGEYYCVLVSLSEVVKHRVSLPLCTVGAAWRSHTPSLIYQLMVRPPELVENFAATQSYCQSSFFWEWEGERQRVSGRYNKCDHIYIYKHAPSCNATPGAQQARSSQEYWLCLPLQVWAVPPEPKPTHTPCDHLVKKRLKNFLRVQILSLLSVHSSNSSSQSCMACLQYNRNTRQTH